MNAIKKLISLMLVITLMTVSVSDYAVLASGGAEPETTVYDEDGFEENSGEMVAVTYGNVSGGDVETDEEVVSLDLSSEADAESESLDIPENVESEAVPDDTSADVNIEIESETEYTDSETSDAKETVESEDISDETDVPDMSETDESQTSADLVQIKIEGDALVEGVDENGMAELGSVVSIEVTNAGYVLAVLSENEKGEQIYTAVPLDYNNCYEFIVEEEMEFVVTDPDEVDYAIINAASNKSKLTGAAGIKLTGLTSSAQGYKEIVLNFTAVKNGSDGTETENVYYEVKVTATPNETETLPAGSPTTPRYYYIPKTKDVNTQSKSIQVNNGNLSADTACTYEFAVKMVNIGKTVKVPDADEDKYVSTPLTAALEGNTITKSFSTKNLYYEDKLGFTKKNTTIYTGQKDLYVGAVKYSKNASYLHDLTAVAYDSRGAVCQDLTCTFKNDNDELYISADEYMYTGKYTVVVYAGIGEEETAQSPQGGTMYQASASFTLTVVPGINWIYTGGIVDRIIISSKNVTFSAVPVGYGGYEYDKAKTQKFTYEVKSVDSDGYTVIEPTENVKNNVTVSNKGKVTVKKEYNVGTANDYTDYIAIVITAADFEGNEETATKIVAIKGNAQTPSTIYLSKNGYRLTGNEFTADQVEGARIVVEDQGGINITQYMTITPTDNSKGTAGIYVEQYSDNTAYLHVRKCGTVTIKAKSRDGKNKTLSLKLNIKKPSFSILDYSRYPSITSDGFSVSLNNYTWKSYGYGSISLNYSAPLKGAEISFLLGAEIAGTDYFGNSYQWFDWKYSIKGGSVKRNINYFTVKPTAKIAEMKVWVKDNPKTVWTFTFTNDRWGETYETAPKLKLVGGKFYSNKYSNNEDVLVYDDDYDDYYYDMPYQTLTYSYDYLSVRNMRVARLTKNAPSMSFSLNSDARTITAELRPGNDIKPGSYKYKIAFYDEYGYLYCKPITVTIKVNKSPKIKLTSSYTMDSSQGSVKIKSTPNDFIPDYDTALMNANVGGKANDFNKYFELAYETDSTTGKKTGAVIRFKSSVTQQQKDELKGKSITGYVRYSYYYGYDHIKNATSKVTIKVK